MIDWIRDHIICIGLTVAVMGPIVTFALAACMLDGRQSDRERKEGDR